jgi:hypothetical protein
MGFLLLLQQRLYPDHDIASPVSLLFCLPPLLPFDHLHLMMNFKVYNNAFDKVNAKKSMGLGFRV